MKLSGMLARRESDLAGVVGNARVQRPRKGIRDLVRRVKPGELVVLERRDLDRWLAEALVEAGVVGVVNLERSISGRFPTHGPEILVEAGVVLVDGVAESLLEEVRDGTRLRLHEGGVFAGEREIGRGVEQDADGIADQLVEAQTAMSVQLEVFATDSVEFLRTERRLIVDGIGAPELATSFAGRPALVVSPGQDHREQLRRLKKYIADDRPVLVGVNEGAEALRSFGYRPDVVVGEPELLDEETLRRAGEIVLPADLGGHAPGAERIRALEMAAVTFPAQANPEDLALLLTDVHGAELVVAIGYRATLREFLDRGRRAANPSTVLTRLRLGDKLVDADAVAALRKRRRRPVGVIVTVLVVLALACAAVVVSGPAAGPLLDSGRSVLGHFWELFR